MSNTATVLKATCLAITSQSGSTTITGRLIPISCGYGDVSSKAVKKAIMNADKAYKSFLKGKSGFPKFKRHNGRPVSMYLPRNNPTDLKIERHHGKIPTLGWVCFKKYGYVPCDAKAISVTVTRKAGRYFASEKAEA